MCGFEILQAVGNGLEQTTKVLGAMVGFSQTDSSINLSLAFSSSIRL